MPKVSVIIPAYNRKEYIVETINSVLNQTFSDFEIIVVDDGSTDDTEKIVREQFKDKVICLRKPNGGPASARNMGISIARGEYIAFVDADDLWFPEKLEVQTHFMDTHLEYGLTFSWSLTFKEPEIGQLEDFSLIYFRGNPTLKLLLQRNFIPILTVMARKACFEDTKGFDEEKELIGMEDYELWIRIAIKYKIACIPRVLARYRIHDENLWGIAPAWKIAEAYFTIINRINKKVPNLITDMFGDKKSFYADRYRYYGDEIPFRKDPKGKAKLYREMIRINKADIKGILKLFCCYLIVLKNVVSRYFQTKADIPPLKKL